MGDTREKLKRLYRDTKGPGSFAGIRPLYRRARESGLKVTHKQVQKFLQSEDPYTLHGKVIKAKNGVLNDRIITWTPYDMWEADIMHLPGVRRPTRQRGQYRYFLCVIDNFTKYAWARPLKKKDTANTHKAFASILKEGLPPKAKLNHLRTDEGNEFVNRSMRTFLRQHGINRYRAQKEPGAAVAERFQRTIGDHFSRWITSRPQTTTKDVVESLPDFLASYNASRHDTTRFPPVVLQEAAYRLGSKGANEILADLKHNPAAGSKDAEVLRQAAINSQTYVGRYKDPNPRDPVTGEAPKAPLFPGQKVRILTRKNIFEKGRAKTFSDEVWTVVQRDVSGNPNLYQLADASGDEMIGTMYRWLMQPVEDKPKGEEPTYEVRVLRRQRDRILIEYVGMPALGRRWIPRTDLVDER